MSEDRFKPAECLGENEFLQDNYPVKCPTGISTFPTKCLWSLMYPNKNEWRYASIYSNVFIAVFKQACGIFNISQVYLILVWYSVT